MELLRVGLASLFEAAAVPLLDEYGRCKFARARLRLFMVRADLGTLRSDRLQRLTIRAPRIGRRGDGLGMVPADLPLRELVVANLAADRDLGRRRAVG